ncbi:MAG: hypothetical protein V1929_05865 [bacterium]
MSRGLSMLERLEILRGTTADAATITALQDRRLQRIVHYAYERVPYYRGLFDQAGLTPDRIRTAADLRLIPVTTRREFQAMPLDQRLPEGIDPNTLHPFTTSGTTGRPLEMRQTEWDKQVNDMLALRLYRHHGMKPWHRKLGLRSKGEIPVDNSLHAKFGLFRRGWISTRWTPDQWVKTFRAFKPDIIFGYSLTLGVMARVLMERGVKDVRPICVMTSSNVLDAKTRADIQEGFGCPVYDVYASWEGGIMAWECGRCPGYHINADWVIVEILRGNRPALPGEAGDAVITSLHSFGMPFIRYKLGDVAVRNTKTPVCGCALPLLGDVFGRQGDLIVTPDGRTVSPHTFLALMDHVRGVECWRLVQEKPDRFRAEIVARQDFGPDAEAAIRDGIVQIVEQKVHVEIMKLEKPTWVEDSKFRPIVSEVGTS